MANEVNITNDDVASVEVQDENTAIVVENTENVVIVQEGGPQGASGAELEDKHYVHTQNAASTSWTITHNLGKMPSVEVVDTGDNIVVGEIEYLSLNQVRVTFGAAFTGKAYLN